MQAATRSQPLVDADEAKSFATIKAAGRRSYLFVLPWSLEHLGGVNQVVINLARELVRSNRFDPIVLVTDWRATQPVWEIVHGLNVVRWRIRPFEPGMGWKAQLAFPAWEHSFARAFAQFCLEHKVAVINVHFPVATTLALERVARGVVPGLPFLLSFHGADVSTIARAPAAAKLRWHQLLRRAAAVVVCSQDLRDRVETLFDSSVKPEVIHNGLDAADFVAMAGLAPIALSRTILNVAKFEAKKGQDVLIEAFAAIVDRYADVTLVLIGATDTALKALQTLCIERGVAHRVRFRPDVPYVEVAAMFRQATVFALSSREEPFGIVLLEAAAFGLPVVASRVGGIPEILTDGLTGRLVPPGDVAALAAGLREMLDAPIAAREMGERLRQDALARFSWPEACRKYLALALR